MLAGLAATGGVITAAGLALAGARRPAAGLPAGGAGPTGTYS